MDPWALQTSRLTPNPCPLPWVSDYKVIPPSLSCSNWISLRDLWKLTLANDTPPPKKKRSWSFQNINYSTMMPACEKGTHDGFVCLVAQLKSTSAVAALSWGGGARLSPQPRLHAGEGHMLGRPERQVAAVPAGWARSNQGCGAQPELPTSARLARGWLKAKFHPACAWEWPWGESKTVRLINAKEIRPLLRLTSNGLYTGEEKIPLL